MFLSDVRTIGSDAGPILSDTGTSMRNAGTISGDA